MLSRVVPGRSWTTERSSPMIRLNSVDLPTLGRPTMATEGADLARFATSSLRRAGLGGQPGHHLVEQVPGAPTVQGAHRERVAQAQPGEGPGVGVAAVAVDLVGDHQGRPVQPPQQVGHPGVLLGDPDGGVDDEQDDRRRRRWPAPPGR